MDARVPILCYHAVSDEWPSELAVGAARLEAQLRFLLGRGYRPRTLSGALAANERAFVVTFDDAFASVAELAAPILARHGVPATLFVPTDFAAEAAPMTWSTLARWTGTGHERELRCMSWEQVRRLAAAGWEVGSHTCSHADLTAVGRERAAAELRGSRAACEAALQLPCSALAYPFGAHDDEVVGLAAAAGYECAATLGTRLLGPRRRDDPLRLSREGVYRKTGRPQFRLAVSPALGALRGTHLFRRLAPG